MDRSGVDQKLVRQGTLSRGTVERAGRRVFLWSAAEPDRPTTSVRSGKAVEGPAPARIRPTQPPLLKNRVMPPWNDYHTFAIPAKGCI